MSLGDFAYTNHGNCFLAAPPLANRPHAPFVVAGVPYDGAVTNRPGARFGPEAIRRASLMLCDGIHPVFNVSPLPVAPQTCLDEFQWLVMGSNVATGSFTEGWARISFVNPTAAVAQTRTAAQSTNVGRPGVPAIATYMIKEPNKFTWAYASSTR